MRLSLPISNTPQTHPSRIQPYTCTHFHVEMGRIRVGSHQRFYGINKTICRRIHQCRAIAGALGGGEGRMGGWRRIEEERLVHRVLLCVCVWESAETVRRVIKGDPSLLILQFLLTVVRIGAPALMRALNSFISGDDTELYL